MVTISKGNTKVGRIANISLPPVVSCGNCEYCAKSCYALKAYRMYKNTKKAWDGNLETFRNDFSLYFMEIASYIQKHGTAFFRWHVSGDIPNQLYLDFMIALAVIHPATKFLVFTKMFNLDYSRLPKNLSVVFSIFPGMPLPKKRTSIRRAWMQDGTEKRIPADAIECAGNCESCGMCWDLKNIGKDVFFHKH